MGGAMSEANYRKPLKADRPAFAKRIEARHEASISRAIEQLEWHRWITKLGVSIDKFEAAMRAAPPGGVVLLEDLK